MTMNEITPELIEKAKEAKTAAELLKMAEDEGVMLTEAQAQQYFDQLNPTMGELDDDELDNVSGGACGRKSVSYNSYGFSDGQKMKNSGAIKFQCYQCTGSRKTSHGPIFNIKFYNNGQWWLKCFYCSNPYRGGRNFSGNPRDHGLTGL